MSEVQAQVPIVDNGDHPCNHYSGVLKALFRKVLSISPVPEDECARAAFHTGACGMNSISRCTTGNDLRGGCTICNNSSSKCFYGCISFVTFPGTFCKIYIVQVTIVSM